MTATNPQASAEINSILGLQEDRDDPNKLPIIDFIINAEGSKFVPNDNGQPSKFGIRRDTYEAHLGQPVDVATIRNLTEEDARRFYDAWYDKHRINNIESPPVKLAVFDGVVNQGPGGMGQVTQSTLKENFGKSVEQDGVIGSETIGALNEATREAGAPRVMSDLLDTRWQRYQEARTFQKDGPGWKNRLQDVMQVSNVSLVENDDGSSDPVQKPAPPPKQMSDAQAEKAADVLLEMSALENEISDEALHAPLPSEEGFLESAARSFGRGVLRNFSDIPRFVGYLFNSDSAEEIANGIDNFIDAPEEEFANSGTGQLFNALGQVVGLVAGGLASAPAKIGTRLISRFGSKEAAERAVRRNLDAAIFPTASGFSMGGVEQANDYYQEARERGEEVDESVEKTALFLGGSIGLLESLFPGRILNTGFIGRFTKSFDRQFTGTRIRSAAGGAILEGATEATQSVLHDVVGRALYDADPKIAESINQALNEGTIGGAVGAILGFMLPRGIKQAGGATPPTPVDNVPVEDARASSNEQDTQVLAPEQRPDSDNLPPVEDSRLRGGDPRNSQSVTSLIESSIEENAGRSNPAQPEPRTVISPVSQVFEIGNAYDKGQRLGNTELYKQQVFETYEKSLDLDESITDYDTLLEASVQSAKKTIDQFLERSGLKIVRGKIYTSALEIKNDIDRNNTLSVGPSDAKGGGLFDEIAIQDGHISYGEVLNALTNVSRLEANVDFGYTSDFKAADVVQSMFTDLEKASVSTHIGARIANRYTLPNNRRVFSELTDLERNAQENDLDHTEVSNQLWQKLQSNSAPDFILPAEYTILTDRITVPDNLSDAEIEARELFLAAAEPGDDFSMSNYIAATGGIFQDDADVADVLNKLGLGERVEGRDDSSFLKRISRFIQYSLLNKKDRDLAKKVRNVLGLKGASSFDAQSIATFYVEQRKEYVNSEEGKQFDDPESAAEAFDLLTSSIFEGDAAFIKKNSALLPTPDNVEQDADGNFLAVWGETNIRVPKEMMSSIGKFAIITDKYRQVIVDSAKHQKEQISDRINDINVKVQSHVLQMADAVRAKGVANSSFKAFKDDHWVNNVENSSGEFSLIGSAINQLFVRMIGGTADPNVTPASQIVQVERNVESEQLRKEFFEAAHSSGSISEFIEKTGGKFGTAENMPTEVLMALGAYANNKHVTSLFSSIALEQEALEHLQSTHEFLTQVINNPLHLSRAYRAYEDPKWLRRMIDPKTDEEIRRKERLIQEIANDINQRKYGGKDTSQARHEAESKVNDIVTKIRNSRSNDGSSAHIVDGVEFAGSALLARGNLSPAYREFLGEYTDPETQMQATVNRVARAAYQTMMNNTLYSQFIGNGLYTDSQRASLTDAERNRLVQVMLPQEYDLFKNRVFYATPTIANTIESLNEEQWVGSGPMKIVNMISTDFRKYQTVYSIQSGSANIIAGLNSVVMTGAIADRNALNNAKTAYVDLFSALRNGDDGYIRDIVERVGGAEPNVQDILRHQSFGRSVPGRIWDQFQERVPVAADDTVSFVGAGFESFTKMMMDFYALGDLGPKIMAYLYNKNLMISKLGVNEEVAADMATDIVRKTMFDYNEVPSIVKRIRDFPLVGGGFLSWPALTITTSYNAAKVVGKMFNLESVKWGSENIAGFNPNNPGHRRRAKRGFLTSAEFLTSITAIKSTGFVTGMMMPLVMGTAAVAAAKGMGMLLEDDDQERSLYGRNGKLESQAKLNEFKTAMNALMPEYYKNTSKLIVDINDNGNVEWINTSRLTNYGNMAEAVNALTDPNVDDLDERAWNATKVLTEDYFATGFGLQAVNAIRNNETQFGRKIVKEGDNIAQDFANILDFVGKEIYINGSFETAWNQLRSWTSEQDYNKHTGEEVSELDSFMRLAGLRKIEFDPASAMGSAAWQIADQNRQASSLLTASLRSFSSVSDREVRKEVLRRKKTFDDAMDEAIRVVEAGRTLGMSDQQILSAFKGKVAQKDMKKIIRGQRPVFSLKQLGDSQIERVLGKGVNQEAKNIFQKNYQKAHEYANQL